MTPNEERVAILKAAEAREVVKKDSETLRQLAIAGLVRLHPPAGSPDQLHRVGCTLQLTERGSQALFHARSAGLA